MRALLYGVRPEPFEVADDPEHPLLAGLSRTPMRLTDMEDPGFLLPDWVVTRPRLTGICGSDSKQVFGDWGEVQSPDNPMKAWFSLPQVLGHEVVADVVALGPEAEGFDVGDRVVLNPWLSCAPRGVSPVCPACEQGDYSLCWSYAVGPIAPGIHTGTSKDASGGYATLMPAHDSMLFKVPDGVPDELAVFADPFAVSLHAVTRHPPPPGGRVMVYGAGALGTCATAILRALIHGARVVAVPDNFDVCLDIVRELGERPGVEVVNSVNPARIEGQKTAAFEIVDVLGDAPTVHCIPVGNAGNITAYWKGYGEYLEEKRATRAPRMLGWQAAGAAPIVRGEPIRHPETLATAIQIGNPASWKQAVAARDESGGHIGAVTDGEILEAYRLLASVEGVFVEPASAASVAGLLRAASEGLVESSDVVACTVTGHGLKDPQRAIAEVELAEPVLPEAAAVAEAIGL